jgi:hypothetical protein
MMTSRSLICLLENQNGGKLQNSILCNKIYKRHFFYDQINKWNTQTKQATFLLNVNLNIQTK